MSADRNDVHLDIDKLLERLLQMHESCPSDKFVLMSDEEINLLCDKAKDIFLNQPMLLELQAPIKICGNIHGHFSDLLRYFECDGFPPKSNYLFLGNYVNRGRQSLETICLLLAIKIKYPEHIFLLRGTSETSSINRIYGFYEECKQRCNIKVWKSFNKCFNCLPVTAVIEHKIFCCHGGLSPELSSFEQIRQIQRPIDESDAGLLHDLLWSDPDKDLKNWNENDASSSYRFGVNIVNQFLNQHNMDLICRTHQVVKNGYEFFANRRLVTIYSAVDFLEFENDGALMSVNENLVCSFTILHSSKKQKNLNVTSKQQAQSPNDHTVNLPLNQRISHQKCVSWAEMDDDP